MGFLLDTPIYCPDNSLQTKFKVKGLMLCQTVIIQFYDNEQTNVSVYILFCTHIITNKSVSKAGSIVPIVERRKKMKIGSFCNIIHISNLKMHTFCMQNTFSMLNIFII